MSSFALLVICFQACLVQNVFCWIAEPTMTAGCAPGLIGSQMPFASAASALGPFGPSPFAPALSPAAYEAGLGPYGGEGIGDIVVAGEMPVAGTTLLQGQVPILGSVRFAGDLPAGGIVTIAGSSGARRYPYAC